MLSLVAPVNRPYLEIGQKLIEKLANGEYQVGDRLPAERIIATELDVSRAVIREAFIMLELLGLVEVRKGSGIYIKALPDLTQDYSLERDDRYNREQVGPFEMLQARQVIESRVAELAATQITKNDLLKLRKALALEREQIERGTIQDEPVGDELFHRGIAEVTQNSVLIEIVGEMWDWRKASPLWERLHHGLETQEYKRKWITDHELILAKLQQKDAKAAGIAMWQHLENVKDTLMLLSDVDDPNFDGFIFSETPLVE